MMLFTISDGHLVLSVLQSSQLLGYGAGDEALCLISVLGKSLSKPSLSWEHCMVCLLWEICLEKSYTGTPKEIRHQSIPNLNSEDGIGWPFP